MPTHSVLHWPITHSRAAVLGIISRLCCLHIDARGCLQLCARQGRRQAQLQPGRAHVTSHTFSASLAQAAQPSMLGMRVAAHGPHYACAVGSDTLGCCLAVMQLAHHAVSQVAGPWCCAASPGGLPLLQGSQICLQVRQHRSVPRSKAVSLSACREGINAVSHWKAATLRPETPS